MAGVALGRPFSAIPGRTLLATFTVSDICQKPQEVAITIANSLVEGTGLTVAESEAIAKAGSQCCSKLQAALASASSYAESEGTRDEFTSAAANAAAAAGFKGCAQESFAAVTTSATTGAAGNQATVETAAGGTGNFGPSSTSSSATLSFAPGGGTSARARGSVGR
ncbi:hypothetical protein Ndes2526B_g02394 [Nannochloris sp. 'desiccata']